MKKFLLGCLVLVALAAAALPPLLEKQVEQLALSSLKAWDNPKPASAEAARCSFWQRTLTLSNLTFAQGPQQDVTEYRIATLTVQVPLSLLWNAASILAGQSAPDRPARVDVAESFSLSGLTSTNPQVKMTSTRGHGSRIAVNSTVLGQLLRGAPVQEEIQPWKQVSLDEAVLEDIKVDTFQTEEAAAGKKPADMAFTTARYTLRDWDGAVLDTLRAEDCTVFGEGQRLLHLKAAEYKGIKAPSDALYARALKLNEHFQNENSQEDSDENAYEDEAVALCKDFFLQDKPFVDSFTVEGLEVDEALLPLKAERVTFDWRATAPWDSTFSVKGFSLPASVPAKAWRLRLPALKQVEGDMALTVTGLGGDTFREQLSITAPALADVEGEIRQTWEDGLYVVLNTAALINLTLDDMKLHVVDHGLLAYVAGNLTNGQPDALQPRLRELQALLQEQGRSAAATELTDNLLNFIQNPGTLDVTLRKKSLGILELAMYSANPAALLKTSVTPGKTTLDSQLRALFTAAPAAKE